MLASNQWPLQIWYYCSYRYSFSALNHCVSSRHRAEHFFISLGESEQRDRRSSPRLLLTLEASDKAHRQIRKYTIKQFEITIVIMSYLLSLISRVTFHTRKSRGSLKRGKISVCQATVKFTLFYSSSQHKTLHHSKDWCTAPSQLLLLTLKSSDGWTP